MSVAVNLLIEVCDELKLPYTVVGDNTALLKIHFKTYDHFVLNAALGLNTDAQLKLTQDKFYTYQLLSSVVKMPYTQSYIDPDAFGPFGAYVTFISNEEILDNIEENFEYPVIIKRNSGTQGKNVFLSDSREKSLRAIESIYSKKQMEYDHVLLAEQYIKPKQEYRVVILNGKVELVYLKDITQAKFVGNLSPLHWNNAKARIISDKQLVNKIQTMVDRLYAIFPIKYAGLDIIEDLVDKLWLIELNSTPQFGEFIKTNDPMDVKRIFKKALMIFAENTPKSSYE